MQGTNAPTAPGLKIDFTQCCFVICNNPETIHTEKYLQVLHSIVHQIHTISLFIGFSPEFWIMFLFYKLLV